MSSLETDEEIEPRFASMFSCHCASITKDERIIDSGVSDYMSANTLLVDHVHVYNKPKVSLTNGKTSTISYFGRPKLNNELALNNVCAIKLDTSTQLVVHQLTSTSTSTLPQCLRR